MLRISALAIFTGATSLALSAQQPAQPQPSIAASAPSLQLVAALSPGTPSLAALAGVDYSSSSSGLTGPVDPDSADRLSLPASAGETMQPPPRRRYGRPRYNDSSHNPDGSNKYTFVLGGGFTGPVGNTFHYLNTNYGIQIGGGRNFNKNFGVLAQFDYDRFGFNGRTLANQLALYNYCDVTVFGSATCAAAAASALPSLDGNSHIWSFTLNPIYTFNMTGAIGAYVVGGVGFYHKVANFTTPETGEVDYYGILEEEEENAVIDHYTSNAPGFNGGVGITFKPSRFAGERLFVEGRYIFIDNSQRTGITVANINTPAGQTYYLANGANFYPANSNRTTYTTYKFGIRF